jgi:hypothetical protein
VKAVDMLDQNLLLGLAVHQCVCEEAADVTDANYELLNV